MKELFLAELRRFRTAALLFALAHLLLQLVVNRIQNLLETRYEVHMVALAGYMACGLAFGLYQFGTWRQTGRWIWLLHRPLPRIRVFAAVAGASALLIVFAVGLPALAALLATKWFTARVVDLRHYTLVAHLVLLTLIAWAIGAHIILNRSRAAAIALVLPLVMLAHSASGFVMLLPAVACTALLACIAYGSFKPDRLTPPQGLWMTGLMALLLQLGFYLALATGMSVLFQVAQMAAGVHPLSNPTPAGYFDLMQKSGNEAMQAGLAVSRDPRAPHWRQELGARKVGSIQPMGRQFPVRDQASNREVIAWPDAERRILWTFSHDAMRFHGRDMLTGADRGWFGLHGFGDSTPFPSVPVLPRPAWIMTAQHFYQIDFGTQTTRELVALSGGEVLATPPAPPVSAPPGAHLYTLTNQRLIAHPVRDSGAAELVNEFSVALPAPFSDLGRIGIAELPDGTLLSFNHGRKMMDGAPASMQTVVFVDPQGGAEVIAQRPLVHDFGLLFEHRDWWLSPVLQAVEALPVLLLDKGMVLDKGKTRWSGDLLYPRPPLVIACAALCSLLSAFGAWAWLRGAARPAPAKAGWIAACLLLGVPALLSLLVLQPRASAHARELVQAPARAAA
jgi:hypothetical protein